MKTQTAEELNYGFSKTVDADFEQAIEKTREALKEEGFGVLSEIRLDEKLKEKLGVDFRRYIILGACNPPLAYETLQQDINIGLLLPCNVVVYEAEDENRSVVAAIDASIGTGVSRTLNASAAPATWASERSASDASARARQCVTTRIESVFAAIRSPPGNDASLDTTVVPPRLHSRFYSAKRREPISPR